MLEQMNRYVIQVWRKGFLYIRQGTLKHLCFQTFLKRVNFFKQEEIHYNTRGLKLQHVKHIVTFPFS